MKKTALCLLVALMPALFACSAQADDAANLASVKQAFQQRFKDKPVLSVAATPVKGVYEVVLKSKQIVYVNPKVDYLFVGDLIDVKNGKSLTEEHMAKLSKVDWSQLPLADAIKVVHGNGARKLAVFSDPDCPFCKKLEQDSLKDLDNVTIYTFLYPLTQLHPDAMQHAKQIWCAKDPAAAWTEHMVGGKAVTGAADCVTPIDRNLVLGQKLGVNGTPALIFANGQMVPGAIDKADLEKMLDAK